MKMTKLIGLILPIFMALGVTLAVSAEEAPSSVVEINSAEDLMKLSADSVLNENTKGKTYELKRDIDLSMEEFQPIASFSGTFKGNGHTISGLYWNKAGSDMGLFRFLEPDGVIEDLVVRATMLPQGSRTGVGALVGCNRGRISRCTVSGKICGDKNTGGVAGKNESGGLIEFCRNEAIVEGLDSTGGIVGLNEGIIENCENQGEINTAEKTEDKKENRLNSGTSSEESISLDGKILDAEKVYHTGGIAGKSTGTIRGCTNTETIGYPHSGYNNGGIAGLQNGYVTGCSNAGNIRGRKDTGGIVGQFEPYVRMSYQEDTIQKVQGQIDVLLDQLGELADTLGNAGDHTVTNMESLRNSVKNMRSGLQNDKKYYFDNTKSFTDDLDGEIDKLQKILDDMEVDSSDSYSTEDLYNISLTIRHLDRLRSQLKDSIKNDPAGAKMILEDMGSELGDLGKTIKNMPRSLANDVDGAADSINDKINSLRDNTESTADLIEQNKDKLFEDLENTDAEIGIRADAVAADLDQLFEQLKSANEDTQSQAEKVRSQMRLISDTINGRIHEWEEREKEKQDSLFDDVSDDETEGGSGLVSHCENQGLIEADSNTGGIVGIIGMELSLDPENDMDVDGDYSLKIDRTARASVRYCVNREKVMVTNNYVGGIVGRADAGALIENQNYGDVKSKDGSYIGGIAGGSTGMARNNKVLCQLDGKNYIGGITGKGDSLVGNCAMVSVIAKEKGEYRGAVAGKAEGEIRDNAYVWEGLAAVNGVTYETQAKNMTYEELLMTEGLPEEFNKLWVRFLAEGKEVACVQVPYGKGVGLEEVPQIPQKKGFYALWEDAGQSCVHANLQVNAEYVPWTTSIASFQRDGVLSVLLAQGQFYPDTELKADGNWQTGYTFTIQTSQKYDQGLRQNKDITLRLIKPHREKKEKWKVVLLKDHTETIPVHLGEDGSYLVISPIGGGILPDTEYVLMLEKENTLTGGTAAGAAILLAAVVFGIWYSKTKKKNPEKDHNQKE